MKLLILAASLVFSFSALAERVSFTYFGNENGNQYYYACSYVQGQTEQYLETFGARNISVRCNGGIATGGGWTTQPVSIYATFDLPEVTGSQVEEVEIKGDTWNPSCGVNVRIMRELLPKFKNVEVVKKSDFCAFASSNYYYKLNVSR